MSAHVLIEAGLKFEFRRSADLLLWVSVNIFRSILLSNRNYRIDRNFRSIVSIEIFENKSCIDDNFAVNIF